MAVKLSYHPSDLAYYTTWWLTSKSSTSSTTKSINNSIEIEDECITFQSGIQQDDLKTNCCIPMKIFRIKR